MALSSTTATAYISRQNFLTPTTRTGTIFIARVTFASKPRRFLIIRNSTDASSEATAATETKESESSIELPTGPPSLISALNVERALRGIPITDADYYGILGLQRDCTCDQVTAAYRNKVEELLNQGLDQEQLEKEMQLLKESYIILSSADERRMYDWSLARSEKPDTYTWPFEVDEVKPPTEPPPPQEPEDVGTTRLVGYFLLGLFILSVVLSVLLNQ